MSAPFGLSEQVFSQHTLDSIVKPSTRCVPEAARHLRMHKCAQSLFNQSPELIGVAI